MFGSGMGREKYSNIFFSDVHAIDGAVHFRLLLPVGDPLGRRKMRKSAVAGVLGIKIKTPTPLFPNTGPFFYVPKQQSPGRFS